MPDSVPVSPAAQAVETPELWWSPSRRAITETGRGAVHVLTRSGVLDVTGLEWRNLPADAVRLVPAPGPDTEASAVRPRMRLLPVKASCGRGHHQGCAPFGAVALCGCRCHPRAHREVAAGVRTDGETPQ